MDDRKFLLILRLIGIVLFGLGGYLASRAMELGGVMLWISAVLTLAAASIIYLTGNGVFDK